MTIAQLVPLVAKISIAMVVFALALQARPGDLLHLARRPALLLRSILAMNVIMPVLAALTASFTRIPPEVRLALILLAVSPVPPVLPGKESKAGGNVSYAIGLLFTAALLSIATVPLSVMVIGRLFGYDVSVPPSVIAITVGTTVLAPLLAGVLVRNVAASLAGKLARPLSMVGTILLLVAVVPILIGSWPAVRQAVGDGAVVAIVLFTVVGLLVGHLLGGPDPENRTVLALSTASRHPGVAIAIAGSVVAGENKPEIVATVILAVLAGAIVTAPYVKLRKRSHLANAPAPAATA